VEGAQIEFPSLFDARFGEEFCDLEFADVTVSNGPGLVEIA
jgi:hypothetical protein